MGFELNRLSDEPREAIILTLRPAVFDRDIPPLDVLELATARGKGGAAFGPERGRQIARVRDPPHLPHRLRLDGERRGEEAARDGADEGTSIQWTLPVWSLHLGATGRPADRVVSETEQRVKPERAASSGRPLPLGRVPGAPRCTRLTSAYNVRLAAPAVVMTMPTMSTTAYGDGDENTGLGADGDT